MNKKIIIFVFLILLIVRLYPVAMNEFPKGSDSWYHLDRVDNIADGSVFFDPLNAGGSYTSYPPFFHLIISPFTWSLEIAKYIGPIIGFLAVLAFFFFIRKYTDEKVSLVASFVFGISVEIMTTSMFLFPENLGFLLLFISLYAIMGNEKLFLVTSSLLALTHTLSFLVLILFLLVLFTKKIKYIMPSLIVFVVWGLLAMSAGAVTTLIAGSPLSLESYIFGFSPLFFALAVIGMEKNARLTFLFMAMTLYSFLIVLYPERVFSFAIIPASLLAGIGFVRYWERSEQYTKAAMVMILVLAALFALDFGYAQGEMSSGDKATLDWIRENTSENATIASTWQVSAPWMPHVAERSNILGSFQESVPDFRERRRDLETIFTGNEKSVRKTMEKYNASYIFINGIENRHVFKDSIKRLDEMFIEVFNNGETHLYKI